MGPSPHLWFLHSKQRLLDQSKSLYGCHTSLVVLCMQNRVICTRISSLHGFQLSSVVLCMQNCDFRTRLTSLYGSQSSSVVLSTHNSVLSTRIKRLYGFQPSPVILCMQNRDFSTRITSLCWRIDPTLWFLQAKQRLLEKNNKSLWVPVLICGYEHT